MLELQPRTTVELDNCRDGGVRRLRRVWLLAGLRYVDFIIHDCILVHFSCRDAVQSPGLLMHCDPVSRGAVDLP